jgi:hypothetical protein
MSHSISIYLLVSIYLSVCLSFRPSIHPPMSLQPFVTPWPLFQFLNLYRIRETPWMGDQPVARPLPTHRAIQTQNKRTETSTPRVGFEPTIPLLERTKKVHALDRAAIVIGLCLLLYTKIQKLTNVIAIRSLNIII